jgi:tetratricopeptide (TPR) repeat protein
MSKELPQLQFQAPVAGAVFNLCDQHGVCVTGDHNVVYQIVMSDKAQLDTVLAEIQARTRNVEDVPEAVPLPTLVLQVETVAGAAPARWRLACRRPAAGPGEAAAPVECPSPRTPAFEAQLARFYELAATALPQAAQRAELADLAEALGNALAGLLPEPDRARLDQLGRAEGPPPFLVVESADDAILGLPWELLRLDDQWSVRDGRLDVARCVPNAHAARLEPPTAPVSVHVNICAPESDAAPGLRYETEAYRITRALQEHKSVMVNEMGEENDLLAILCDETPPTVIHYSGHGGPGVLLFEDEFGGPREVPVRDMIARARNKGVQRWPRLFYLACCHGQTSAQIASMATSTAASLHREGIPEIVAHFGPVYDSQATDAETAFYAALGEGKRAREAVRAARAALAVPFAPLPRETQRNPDADPAPAGQVPFAWALLVLYHAGTDHPLGQRLDRRASDAPGAKPRRRDEELVAGGRTKVLTAGFIGRRREQHALRRRLRDGKNVLVVQGLGGLGKSVFCWKSLARYQERHYLPLTLWCAAAEDEPDPAAALLEQFSAAVRPLVGPRWDELVESAVRQLPTPATRLGALLNALVGSDGTPPIALYLDNLESLMLRPDREDYQPNTIGQWRNAECRAVWSILAALAAQRPERLALLASCRYRHPDFPRADWLAFPPMPDDTVFRMLEWFPALSRLSPWTQGRLVPLLGGHPRAVEFLDGFVGAEIRKWEDDQEKMPAIATEAQAEEEWQRFIEPVLEATDRKLREDLLFDALWAKALRLAERRLLVRLTVLRRPAERTLALALADPAEDGRDFSRLRNAGLLEETLERDAEGQAAGLRFEVHAAVARFARDAAGDDWPEWRRQGFRLAGDFFDARLKAAPKWDAADMLDAGHYLLAAGEADRGFEWLLSLTEWQTGRGLLAHALATLSPLRDVRDRGALSIQNQARVAGTVAGCLASLGKLEGAAVELRRAVALGERLARQDPSNAAWQRDLSVSHNKLGDVQLAQGELAGALESFRKGLGIRERLARQDPSNAAWQADMVASLVRISDAVDTVSPDGREMVRASLRRAMGIAEKLVADGRMTSHEQKNWVQELRRRLEALDKG